MVLLYPWSRSITYPEVYLSKIHSCCTAATSRIWLEYNNSLAFICFTTIPYRYMCARHKYTFLLLPLWTLCTDKVLMASGFYPERYSRQPSLSNLQTSHPCFSFTYKRSASFMFFSTPIPSPYQYASSKMPLLYPSLEAILDTAEAVSLLSDTPHTSR